MPISVRVQNFQSILDATVVIDGFTVITGPNNSGKALAHGTPVCTPHGWRPVEDIRPGDFVVAGDGTPTKVLGVYPQGSRETCRITFNDGRTALVDWDHLWSVSIGDGRFTDPKQYVTITTRDLVNRVGKAPEGALRPALPCAGPVQYEGSEFPLDPYLMGVLLGDGCFQPFSVRISSADEEILDAVRSLVPEGVNLTPCGKYDYRIVGRGWRDNPVLDGIRDMGLGCVRSHEKHVPEVYLRSSVADRVALLQGLMDTDGTVNAQGVAEFCSVSRPLAEAVREIAFSLGGTSRIRSKVPTYSHKGVSKHGRRAFTVTMRVPGFALFRLERKLSLVADPKRSVNPLMVSFEDGPEVGCSCIEVEHPSHLFQIEDHIVTHNTAIMRAIKGVFTNAAPGPLVRHGTNHLTVTIDFGDGNIVKWEKGWEKPGQKGGTVNRYTINGKVYDKVGATPPDELFDLHFGPTEVGNNKLWPQVADQFEGVLFLIGSTGSTVAEAIADVERVGKLNKALRSCESDKRSARSKLKVRREDYDEVDKEVESFKSLGDAARLVSEVESLSEKAESIDRELGKARKVAARLTLLRSEASKYAGVGEVMIPAAPVVKKAGDLRDQLAQARTLSKSLAQARGTMDKLDGVSEVELPDPSLVEAAEALKDRLGQARLSSLALQRIRKRIERATVPELDLPADSKVEKVRKTGRTLAKVQGFRDDIISKRLGLKKLDEAIEKAKVELGEAKEEVHAVLGEHGECPTCGTVMGGSV